MRSLFSLTVFLSSMIVGVWIGLGSQPLSVKLVWRAYACFSLLYLVLGLILAIAGPDFLLPEGKITVEW